MRYRFDFTNEQGQTIAVGRITAVFCRAMGPDRLEAVEIPAEVRQRLNGNSTSDAAPSSPGAGAP